LNNPKILSLFSHLFPLLRSWPHLSLFFLIFLCSMAPKWLKKWPLNRQKKGLVTKQNEGPNVHHVASSLPLKWRRFGASVAKKIQLISHLLCAFPLAQTRDPGSSHVRAWPIGQAAPFNYITLPIKFKPILSPFSGFSLKPHDF